MSEADLQRTVMDMARALGWRVYHNRRTARTRRDGTVIYHTSYSGDGGFPDLLLARAGKIIVAELKSKRGVVSDDQVLWIDALGGVGISHHLSALVGVFVWRPADLVSGNIEELLR